MTNKVDVKLLKLSNSKARYRFLINNHRKLIRIMKSLTPEQHHQEIWAEDNHRSPCGTSACALGWAALSEQLPGLEWYKFRTDNRGMMYLPQINGGYLGDAATADVNTDTHQMVWEIAGLAYFGDGTFNTVFANPTHSKNRVILRLQRRVDILKARLANPRRRKI